MTARSRSGEKARDVDRRPVRVHDNGRRSPPDRDPAALPSPAAPWIQAVPAAPAHVDLGVDAAVPEPIPPRKLPPAAAAVLSNLFVSATEIDAVLHLRAHADDHWDEAALGRALRIPGPHAGAVLDGLGRRGFLDEAGGRYRYDPATPALAAAVEQLAALRPGDRVTAVSLIFSRPRGPVADFGADPREPA